MKNLHNIQPSLDERTLAVIWWFKTRSFTKYQLTIIDNELYYRNSMQDIFTASDSKNSGRWEMYAHIPWKKAGSPMPDLNMSDI